MLKKCLIGTDNNVVMYCIIVIVHFAIGVLLADSLCIHEVKELQKLSDFVIDLRANIEICGYI